MSINFIQLKAVADIPEFTRVSVKVKVVHVNGITTVTGGSAKQDVIVADSSAWVCLTLWEEMVETNFGTSYCCLDAVMMRHYGDQDYLCPARSGSCVEEIPDIDDVVEYTADGGQKIIDVPVVT